MEQHYALVYKCLQNDRKAQAELYNLFSGKMFAVCMRYAADYDGACDMMQEGFVKVFKSLDRFNFEGSVEGWVRRIVVNTAIDHYRKASKLHAVSDLEGVEVADSSSEHFLSKMASDDIIALIQKLPAGYRAVLNLYILEEYSHKEIAAMLGITEGTCKSQLARAKAVLRNMINESEVEYERSGKLG